MLNLILKINGEKGSCFLSGLDHCAGSFTNDLC